MSFFSLESLLARIPALLIALSFHEYAHARMAYFWGDSTAKMQGRLTLNPISHLDPIGTLMIMFVGFGWARPVPINPYNFRNREEGLFWVSFAGPGMNLLVAFIISFILIILTGVPPSIYQLFGTSNMLWFVLNEIVLINVFLAIFNFVPLPPLDGSKILSSFLPRSYAHYYYTLEAYGPFILIFLLVFGLLPRILIPIASSIIDGIGLVAMILTGSF